MNSARQRVSSFLAPVIPLGGLLSDEKSGIQELERAQDSPTKSGQAEKKEFEYLRRGTQTLIANFDVATGKVIEPTIGKHRKEDDFLHHCQQLVATDPNAEKWRIVLNNPS